MTRPPCVRLCPAYPGNPRTRIEGESPPQEKGHTVFLGLRPRRTDRVLAPDLFGDLDDHPQLRPLLLLGQDIAFLGRGEAALRRQRELVERDVFGRLVDPPLDRV